MNIAPALQKIENDLIALARDTERSESDSYHLIVLARKVQAQREMLEAGLVG